MIDNNQEMMRILREIHEQNIEMLGRLAAIERSAMRRGAVSGGIAGAVSGSIISVGIELLKYKFGG